jgi:hypothetical protein
MSEGSAAHWIDLNLRRALLLFGTFTQHNSTFRENCRRVGVFE